MAVEAAGLNAAPAGELPPEVVEQKLRLALAMLFIVVLAGHAYIAGAYPMYGLALAVAAWAALLFAASTAMAAGRAVFTRAACVPVVAFALLATWMIARLQWAPVPAIGRESVGNTLVFAITFLASVCVIGASRRADTPATALRWLAGGLVAVCAFGVYQAFGPEGWPHTYRTMVASARELVAQFPGDPVLQGVLHALQERRAAGTLGAPNVYAGISAFAATLSMGAAIGAIGRKRIGWLIGSAIAVVGVVASGSRGGVVALAAGYAVLAALHGFRASKQAVAAAALIVFAAFCISSAHAENDRWLGSSTIQQRLSYWRTGWAMWSESFVTGRGPGAFAVLYPKYRAPGANETQFAHNWIVQRGVEGGAIAVALSLVGIAGAFAASRRELRARTNSVPLIAFAAGAVALLTHGLVDYTLETREAMQDLGLALGVLAGSSAAASACSARARTMSIAGILAAGCALWPYAAKPALALEDLQFARELAQSGEPPEEVERRLQRAISWTPDDPRLWSELGQMHLQSDPKAAVESITKALALNPDSAATHEALALALSAMGRNKDAAREIDKSVALHPLDPSHWLTMAQLALEDGDDARARDAIKHASELPRNPVEEQRLRALQARMGDKPH